MLNLIPKKDQVIQNLYSCDEIEHNKLFMVLWLAKWLIFAMAGVVAVISMVTALSLPNIRWSSANLRLMPMIAVRSFFEILSDRYDEL